MKKIAYIILLIVIIAGCAKEEADLLTLGTSSEISFAGDAAQGSSIRFEAGSNWSASSSAAWCHLSPSSGGKGSNSIAVTVDKNDTDKERNATITIQSGKLAATVTVKQRFTYILNFAESDYTISSAGDTIKVDFTTNIDYEYQIQDDATWIKPVVKSKAANTFTHYFYVEPNDTYENRTAKINFINKDNRETKSVQIAQMQKDAIVPANSAYTVTAQKQDLEFEVKSNIEYSVATSENWIKISEAGTKAFTGKQIKFTIEENNSFDSRTAVILIKGESVEQEVKITQAPWANRMQAEFVHSEETFSTPVFNGRDLAGSIDWGDGSQENYTKDAVHKFGSTNEKTSTYTLHGSKLFYVEIPVLNSIKSINIVYKEEE